MRKDMYVVWLDSDGGGGGKPFPCEDIKPSSILGEEYLELTGVEQIKETARPTMTVTSVTVHRGLVTYIAKGYEEVASGGKEATLELVSENSREVFEANHKKKEKTNSQLKDELISQSEQASLDYDMQQREEKEKALLALKEKAERQKEIRKMREEIARLEAEQKKSTTD